MPAAFRTPNRFDLDRKLLEEKLQQVSFRIKNNSLSTEGEILNAVFVAYREVYNKSLGPESVDLPLDIYDVREENLLNTPFEAAERNIRALANMHGSLQDTQKSSHNYLAALAEMVQGHVSRAASKSVDLRLLSGTLRPNTIVAGDDFTDRSRIDDRLSGGVAAELLPLGGGISLRRISSTDVLEGIPVTISVSGPSGLYEGKQYGRIDPEPDGNPEGTNYRFETLEGNYRQQTIEGVPDDLLARYQALVDFYSADPKAARAENLKKGLSPQKGLAKARKKGSFGGLTTDEWEQIASNFHWERSFEEKSATPEETNVGKHDPSGRESDRTLTPFNSKTFITKGDPAEVQAERQAMIDGDPDSFWEAELVVDTAAEYNAFPEQEEYNPVAILDKITQDVQSRFDNESKFLDVAITLDLGEPRQANFITLLPMRFHPTQVPEVLGIDYSLEGISYTEIPEVRNGGFERKLVEDVNAELSDTETALSLATNKYDYRGEGVFGFSAVRARFLRVRLREQVPVPVHYQTLRLTMQRKTTIRVKRTTLFETKRSKRVVHGSRVLDLDYPTSLEAVVGEVDLRETKFEKDLNRTSSGGGVPTALSGGFAGLTNSQRSSSPRLVGGVLSYAFSPSKKKRVTESDWEITDVFAVDHFDKARYAVGIRELRVFSYRYAAASDMVSKVFFTPKPISTVSLSVDENVPESLSETAPIRYYFSLDDGGNWYEIAPLNSGSRFTGSSHVPQIYHVNSSVPAPQRDFNVGHVDTTTPARSLRARVSITRGADDGVSPILKSYRFRLTLEGSV